MGRSGTVALWLIAVSVITIAGIGAYVLVGADDQDRDVMLVWCEGNRSVVALAASTLGLLPEELDSRLVNLASDDPAESTADLSDDTTLDVLRQALDLASQAPPAAFGDIGFRIGEETFEDLDVLSARAVIGAATIIGDWVAGSEAGWSDPAVLRACEAAYRAFGG